MNDKTGGPAFPVVGHFYGDKLGGQLEHGMTLLDWFAGIAMQGIFTDPHNNTANMGGYDQIARHAYSLADAMLRARGAK